MPFDCKNCGTRVATGKQRVWCSDECGDAMSTEPQRRRRRLFQRDRGICTLCGVDTEAQIRAVAVLPEDEQQAAMEQIRVPSGRRSRFDWWEADHIVPRSQGGSDLLANFRTLCFCCHAKETARLLDPFVGRSAYVAREAK